MLSEFFETQKFRNRGENGVIELKIDEKWSFPDEAVEKCSQNDWNLSKITSNSS